MLTRWSTTRLDPELGGQHDRDGGVVAFVLAGGGLYPAGHEQRELARFAAHDDLRAFLRDHALAAVVGAEHETRALDLAAVDQPAQLQAVPQDLGSFGILRARTLAVR